MPVDFAALDQMPVHQNIRIIIADWKTMSLQSSNLTALRNFEHKQIMKEQFFRTVCDNNLITLTLIRVFNKITKVFFVTRCFLTFLKSYAQIYQHKDHIQSSCYSSITRVEWIDVIGLNAESKRNAAIKPKLLPDGQRTVRLFQAIIVPLAGLT